MFEIGSSLGETRRRQGLELDDVTQATLIRGRYLEALEADRFELLPEGFYRRSFLRRYAEFLGLDGEAYVAEYELRFAKPKPEPVSEPLRARLGALAPLSPRGIPALAGLVVLATIVGVAVWGLSQTGSPGAPKAHAALPPRHSTPRRGAAGARKPGRQVAHRAGRVLSLTAARGNCWLMVRIGSRNGHIVYIATLLRGQTVRFGLRKALWIRFGAPQNLAARLSGRSVTALLPSGSGDLRASEAGLAPSG